MPATKTKNQVLTTVQKNAFHNAIIGWTAPLHPVHEKTYRWYIGASIILTALLAYAIITQAWTFAVALITVAYVYVYTHSKEVRYEEIIISEIGIKEGNNYYPYSSIQGFWIIYNPPFVTELHILTNSKALSEVVIQLSDQDPAEVRQYLCSQIPEFEGKEESFLDLLTRTLKL